MFFIYLLIIGFFFYFFFVFLLLLIFFLYCFYLFILSHFLGPFFCQGPEGHFCLFIILYCPLNSAFNAQYEAENLSESQYQSVPPLSATLLLREPPTKKKKPKSSCSYYSLPSLEIKTLEQKPTQTQ